MSNFDFKAVTHWVFDLDNTLYHADSGLFSQVDVRMTDWIKRALNVDTVQANNLRLQYWKTYGTTLSGLIAHHHIDPDDYLAYVHEIDLSCIAPAPLLGQTIDNLSGQKIIYTNGSQEHARRILTHMGLEACFSGIYAMEDTDYVAKPAKAAFEKVFSLAGVVPQTSVMIEDTARNLHVPHLMGMQTVWIENDEPVASIGGDSAYISHRTTDLKGFLSQHTLKKETAS